MIHQLREDGTANIHAPLLVQSRMPRSTGLECGKNLKNLKLGMCLTQIITTAVAQVGRAPIGVYLRTFQVDNVLQVAAGFKAAPICCGADGLSKRLWGGPPGRRGTLRPAARSEGECVRPRNAARPYPPESSTYLALAIWIKSSSTGLASVT